MSSAITNLPKLGRIALAPRRILPRSSNNGHVIATRLLATSSELPAPPLLLKLRGDLKEAMKAKDTNRLAVLRGVLAEVTNAAKTSNPIKTDIQLLALLRKRASASRVAAEEFAAGKRPDLQDKEMAQVAVIEEYASGIETMSEEDITAAIQKVVGQLRTQGKTPLLGQVIKELLGPEGVLSGKPVENKEVARLAKGMI